MAEKITIKEFVAKRLMATSGFEDKEKYKIEWDESNPYSQYATNLDIAETCVAATIDALRFLGIYPEEDLADDLVTKRLEDRNPQYEVEQTYPIHRQATIYLVLKSRDFEPLTLGDVREWVKETEDLNLSDKIEVEGELALMYDLGLSSFAAIELADEPDNEALILVPRDGSGSPFSRSHPSVMNKDQEELRQKRYEALLKEYASLLNGDDEAGAARIFDEIQRVKNAARR